jgi:hypothetical protein
MITNNNNSIMNAGPSSQTTARGREMTIIDKWLEDEYGSEKTGRTWDGKKLVLTMNDGNVLNFTRSELISKAILPLPKRKNEILDYFPELKESIQSLSK